MNEMTNDAAVAYMTGAWNMRPFVTKMDFGGDETLLHETAKQMHWVPLYHATTVAELRAEVIKERERADKFMWQVRDTCARAEAAERRVAAAIQLAAEWRREATLCDNDANRQPFDSFASMLEHALTKESP